MKRVLLCVLIYISGHIHCGTLDDDYAWEKFKLEYGKIYDSQQEDDLRKFVFLMNKKDIEENRSNLTDSKYFRDAINQFSDWTDEEVKNGHAGIITILSSTNPTRLRKLKLS